MVPSAIHAPPLSMSLVYHQHSRLTWAAAKHYLDAAVPNKLADTQNHKLTGLVEVSRDENLIY